MRFEPLRQNIIDVVQEGLLKLGCRKETLRLYYPLASLNAFLDTQADAQEMDRLLLRFSETFREEFGGITISRKGSRFCLALPPEGVVRIWEETPKDGFLADFIRTIGTHGCTLDTLLSCFYRASDHVHLEELRNGEFDWLIFFEDGMPDSFRYCVTDEGCHLTYHRFTKVDYEAFGF